MSLCYLRQRHLLPWREPTSGGRLQHLCLICTCSQWGYYSFQKEYDYVLLLFVVFYSQKIITLLGVTTNNTPIARPPKPRHFFSVLELGSFRCCFGMWQVRYGFIQGGVPHGRFSDKLAVLLLFLVVPWILYLRFAGWQTASLLLSWQQVSRTVDMAQARSNALGSLVPRKPIALKCFRGTAYTKP